MTPAPGAGGDASTSSISTETSPQVSKPHRKKRSRKRKKKKSTEAARHRYAKRVDEVSAGGLVIDFSGTKGLLIGRLDQKDATRERLLWSLPKGHIEEGETPEEAAIREVADEDSHIGNYLDRDLVDSSTIIRFASTHPGYPHWRWCVAITGDEAHASVNEVWMEPGDGALRIPEWKPWSERIRPGDLCAGDVVETDPKDPRLTAGYTGIADVDGAEAPLHPLQWQIGLGRERVLSPEGLEDAAQRWRHWQLYWVRLALTL